MITDKIQKLKEQGITLIALVVTIIILLILVGVTLNMALSEDGLIKKAVEAGDATEIANEKEILSMSIIEIESENKEITKENLQETINNITGNTKNTVEDIEDGVCLVFFSSKRVYEVNKNGNINYLGKENEIDKVIIKVDKEKDLDPKQSQQVQIIIKKYKAQEDEKIEIKYAWSTSKTEEPDANQYKVAELTENGSEQIALINSGDKTTGIYYLWIKVSVGEEEIKKVYGEYKIQEYATLKNATEETDENSGFLGNTEIQRGNIKSITFTDKINKPNDENIKSWDPGTKEGIIQAWYMTDVNGYYDVTIAQEGGVKANTNSTDLFKCVGSYVEDEVNINGLEFLDTSSVVNMMEMFKNCKNIKELDVCKLDTKCVTNMAGLFEGCSSIVSLNLENFETKNVIYMYKMFEGCKSLTILNGIEKFDTRKVKSLDNMFMNCESLKNLDLNNFNTENVVSMIGMFGDCSNLQTVNVSKFDTKNVKDMHGMFTRCEQLENIDVSGFKTSNCSAIWQMFYGCKNLSSLSLNNFDTSGLNNLDSLFENCENLEELDLRNFDFTGIKKMWHTFTNCNKLRKIDLRNIVVPDESESFDLGLSNNCEILVSTKDIKDWLLSANSGFSNIKIMDTEGNVIEEN